MEIEDVIFQKFIRKRTENRCRNMEIEDVIFLGAGASASEGAPLQGDLLGEYFRSDQMGNFQNNKKMYQRLVDFFRTFFGIDIQGNNLKNISFPTFEEILGIIDLSLNRGESFKNYSSTPDKSRIQRIREDLIFLIAIILDNKLIGKSKYHRGLVNRLKEEKKLYKTAFVSLNYDILIDNALEELYPDFHLDYGVDFTNFEKQNDWTRPEPQRAVCLYKLHGSLNWLYCPTCILLTLTPKEKRVAKLVFKPQNCEVCGGEMVPIIIPPTFFKVMSNFYLQQVWLKSENALKQAKRIFFCGYSFPDADIHIKYLLKRVEINGSSTPEIFIINNHKEKTDSQKQSEELRYNRFFKDKHKVHYTNLSFEDFCERGIGDE